MSEALVLTPPPPVPAVTQQQAGTMVQLSPSATTALDTQVTQFINGVLSVDVHSDEFRTRVNEIQGLGSADIRASAGVSNRMLNRPVQAMEQGGIAESSSVSKNLVALRHTVEDLDPAKQGDLFSPRKLLGLIPFGDKIRDYFAKYRSAQSHLNAIIQALADGKDELLKDNAAVDQEKSNLWSLMQRLEQWVYVGKQVDQTLSDRIAQLQSTDPEKAKVLQQDLLFPVRQKVTDLLTQLAVAGQGYLALDLIRRNNLELVKGVDRATTTTISALRTAVIVAQALANQKLVLDQITALNTTTGNIIESTAHLLQNQTAAINEQASTSTINVEQLQRAFTAIYQTMDAIADYRVKALDSMGRTVQVLSTEVDKAKHYLDKVRSEEVKDTGFQLQA
jgi:uncharacterized protein YaaN involved in tellurite resistance